jgi:hypothetical protein
MIPRHPARYRNDLIGALRKPSIEFPHDTGWRNIAAFSFPLREFLPVGLSAITTIAVALLPRGRDAEQQGPEVAKFHNEM